LCVRCRVQGVGFRIGTFDGCSRMSWCYQPLKGSESPVPSEESRLPLGPEFKLSKRMKSRLKSTIEFSVVLSTPVPHPAREGESVCGEGGAPATRKRRKRPRNEKETNAERYQAKTNRIRRKSQAKRTRRVRERGRDSDRQGPRRKQR
jgi:hypothetical protein